MNAREKALVESFEAGDMGMVEFTELALAAGMSIDEIGKVLEAEQDAPRQQPAGGWVPDQRTLQTLASGLRKFAPELCDALVAKHTAFEQSYLTDLLACLRKTD